MNFKERKLLVLEALYSNRFTGKYKDIQSILNDKIEKEEATQIGRALEKDGFVKVNVTLDSVHAKIEPAGIEFMEEDLNSSSDIDSNAKFSSKELQDINKRLDDLKSQLDRIELGQEITYNDLLEEIEELRELLPFLNKKNWFQLLKGKMVDAGLGNITTSVSNIIIDVFKEQNLLNGKLMYWLQHHLCPIPVSN